MTALPGGSKDCESSEYEHLKANNVRNIKILKMMLERQKNLN